MTDGQTGAPQYLIDCDECGAGITGNGDDVIMVGSGDATICMSCYRREMVNMSFGGVALPTETVAQALTGVPNLRGLPTDPALLLTDTQVVLGEVLDALHWAKHTNPEEMRSLLIRAAYALRPLIDFHR